MRVRSADNVNDKRHAMKIAYTNDNCNETFLRSGPSTVNRYLSHHKSQETDENVIVFVRSISVCISSLSVQSFCFVQMSPDVTKVINP